MVDIIEAVAVFKDDLAWFLDGYVVVPLRLVEPQAGGQDGGLLDIKGCGLPLQLLTCLAGAVG